MSSLIEIAVQPITDPEQINELLTRGVEKVYPTKEELEELMLSGKKLRLYQGFDPSGPDLHIGHAIGMRTLSKFQKLGHEVIFLIGDFTGMIGDPTGKSETRNQLTRDEVQKNIAGWKDQLKRVIDLEWADNPVKILYNYDWLSKLNFEDVLKLTSHITLQQMVERDMFQERIKAGKPIGLHEFMYPLMQGYDSVAMDVDIEVGASDQIFNMLMGRTLMKAISNKDKFVFAYKLLTVESGKKMGKSEGNMIKLTDEPRDIFGKVMAITDGMIFPWFELLTDEPLHTIESMKKEVEAGENPLKYKKQLAFDVTKWISGEKAAIAAQEFFEEAHQKRVTPENIEEVELEEGLWKLPELLADKLNFAASRGEAKRLIQQGAVSINDEKFTDHTVKVDLKKGDIIKCGKTNIIKVS